METPNLFDYAEALHRKRIADDITRNRHRDSPESIAANPNEGQKRASHRRILALLRSIGPLTSKEIAEKLRQPLNAVSGRFSELRAMGLIQKTGNRRDGAAELAIKR